MEFVAMGIVPPDSIAVNIAKTAVVFPDDGDANGGGRAFILR